MMDYRERLKKQNGYTDKMLELNDIMTEVSHNKNIVHVVCLDGAEYTGKAGWYCKADDEEAGFATFTVDTTNNGGWVLGVNEIKSIEIIQ